MFSIRVQMQTLVFLYSEAQLVPKRELLPHNLHLSA